MCDGAQTQYEVEAATQQTNMELQQGLMHAAHQLRMVGLSDEADEVDGLLQAMVSGHLTTDQIQRRAAQLSAILVQSPAGTAGDPACTDSWVSSEIVSR